MRAWLYNRIKNIAGMSTLIGDRVISSGAADNPTEPFLVVQMDPERPPLGLTRKANAQEIHFIAWVHDKPGSMLKIDEVCVLLKNLLPVEAVWVGNMFVASLEWDETGGDAFDDHYSTSTRPVMFTMMTRR